MLNGEFTATTEIYKVMPNFIPKPYGWGKMQSTLKETYFFISEFRRLEPDQRPDEDAFLKRLIELHQRGTSPDGKFGFSVETCDGAVPHDVTWQSSWSGFYARMLQRVAGLDCQVNGHWELLDEVLAITYSHVIPHLLGALSSSSRAIKPSLIHGDMCESNYGVVVWGASSYCAHFGMEVGVWRWAPFMSPFIKRYLHLCGGPSQPVEEFDDRNRLYSVKTKLNFSADGGDEGKKMRIV
jgi:fructosamine-3-kinase